MAQDSGNTGITQMPFQSLQKRVHNWINEQALPRQGGSFTMEWDSIDGLTTFLNETLYQEYSQQCKALSPGYQESGARKTEQVDTGARERL